MPKSGKPDLGDKRGHGEARRGRRALEMTFIEEGRSWHDCDSFQQGRWRRVRRLLQRAAAHEID